MSQVSYYSTGGPWGVSDQYITLDNQTITQTLYLSATNSLGTALTKVKVWFAGNGVDAYQVQSAYLTQGAVSVAVKVNGASSFMVPALGRWSDYSATTSFTLPGNVSFVTVVKLKVPKLIPIVGSGDDTPTGTGVSGVATTVDQDHAGTLTDAQAESLLILNFEGVDEADTWIEEAQGLIPSETSPPGISGGFVIDTAEKKFGSSSLVGLTNTPFCYYALPSDSITGDFTFHTFIKLTSVTTFTFGSVDFLELNSSGESGELAWIRLRLFETSNVPFLNIVAKDKNNTSILNYSIPSPFAYDTWYHLAIIANNRNIMIAVAGTIVSIGVATIDDPFAGFNVAAFGFATTDLDCHWDAMELTNYAKWTSNFTPPTTAPPYNVPASSTSETTSTFTITVSDNTLIDAGDTITISDSFTEVYTFVSIPTGAENEIAIGLDANTTASNIEYALDLTDGALVTADSTTNVVTVTVYSSDTITCTTDSSGLTIGTVTQTTTYTSSGAAGTTPVFTASGTATSMGDMGDYYVNTQLAPLTASGASTMSGNNGSATMPAFRASAQSFVRGYPTLLTDVEKTALLMYGNDWMEWVASLIAIPGDADDVALVATQWVATNITFTTDLSAWGVADYWIDPRYTLSLGVGDSEDGAFLLASIILNSGVAPDNVRIYVGETYGVEYVWCMYKRTIDNQWVVLDWTLGSAVWDAISSVDNLTELYPTILQIHDQNLNSDDYAYGSATEYIDYR